MNRLLLLGAALLLGCASASTNSDTTAPGRDGGPRDVGFRVDVDPDARHAATDAAADTPTRSDASGDTSPDRDVDAPTEDIPKDSGPDSLTDAPPDIVEDAPFDIPDAPPLGQVRVDLRDIWGRPLPDGDCNVRIGGDRWRSDDGIVELEIEIGETATVDCAARDFHDAALSFRRLSEDDVTATRDESNAQFGLAYYPTARTVFVGLQHEWFASTGPAPRDGNILRLMLDGEDTWRTVAERLQAATSSIHAASWWWESDFELIRPDTIVSEASRQRNQVIELLDASAATKRVLIWGHPLASFLNVDEALVSNGEIPRDSFEFMTQENPVRGSFSWAMGVADFGDALSRSIGIPASLVDDRPIADLGPRLTVDLTDFPLGFDVPLASYHQKLWVFDGDEAVVSGMNVKLTDWDSSEHEIFDHRRMAFDASSSMRRAVQDREAHSDVGPRKDFALYIRGPLAQDVEALFASRWNYLIDEGVEYSWNASEIRTSAVDSIVGGIEAQLVSTMPPPFEEYSILESHLNAVRNAEDYIFIEDQYWRAPILVDAIIDRMEEESGLVLIVVTKPVSEFTDPGCYWTHETHRHLRSAFGDRYRTYRLRAFDTAPGGGFIDETDGVFVDMDIHSKLMIVDDVFLSVGSCNKNNRGYVYEGEANVNVLDASWVSDARAEVIGNLLGVSFTPSDWIDELERSADRNADVYEAWEDEDFDLDLDGDPLPFAYDPRGFAYPLDFAAPSECLIEPIGPDIASEDSDEP